MQDIEYFYVLGDGNHIRENIESYLFSHDLESLSKFSQNLTTAINEIKEIAISSMNAQVIIAGGDDILLSIPRATYRKELIQKLQQAFLATTGISISFGIGNTIEAAYLNLRRAKTSKGDKIVHVTDDIMKAIEQLHIHTSSGPPEERKVLIANLDRLIETVKSHMQPPVRAVATAGTLEQLSILIPDDVILAHLVIGWQILSHSSRQKEEPATTQRRVTCGELANLAAQFTTDQGNITQAVRAWHVWAEAFKKSDDPRQAAMAKTFARELTELEEAAATT